MLKSGDSELCHRSTTHKGEKSIFLHANKKSCILRQDRISVIFHQPPPPQISKPCLGKVKNRQHEGKLLHPELVWRQHVYSYLWMYGLWGILKVRMAAKIARSCRVDMEHVHALPPRSVKKSMSETGLSLCVLNEMTQLNLEYNRRCRFETRWRNESEMNCSQLWQVAPEYPVPEQSQENELHVWEHRPSCSHRLGRHLEMEKKSMFFHVPSN